MNYLSGVVLHALFFGFFTAWLAVRKGYGARPWFLLGVLLGAIAAFLLYLQPDRTSDHAAAAPVR